VFVGGWNDALAFEGARYCVLDEDPGEELPADARIPIYDPNEDRPIVSNLDALVQRVESDREHQRPVLLFCGHGIRRAPLAGVWYLHRHEGLSLDEAYARVREVRPKTEHAKEWVGNWRILLDDGHPAAKSASSSRR
jgi:hypothetical protein